MRRLLLPVILVLLLLVGCGAQSGFTSAPTAICPAGASGGAATAPPGSSPTSAGPSAAAAAGSSGSAPQGEIVIVRTGGPDGTQALLAVDGATGTRIARMPVGAVDLASATLVTASPEGGLTVVRSIDLRSGRESASTKIAGSWTLPLVVPGALPEGLAASTGQIVLTDSRPAAGTSRFAVLGRDLVGRAAGRHAQRAVCIRRRGSERPVPVPDRGPRGRPLPGPRIRHDAGTVERGRDRRQARDRRIDGGSADLPRGVGRWHLGADGLRPRGRNGIRAPVGDGQRDRAVCRSPSVGSDDVRCGG